MVSSLSRTAQRQPCPQSSMAKRPVWLLTAPSSWQPWLGPRACRLAKLSTSSHFALVHPVTLEPELCKACIRILHVSWGRECLLLSQTPMQNCRFILAHHPAGCPPQPASIDARPKVNKNTQHMCLQQCTLHWRLPLHWDST